MAIQTQRLHQIGIQRLHGQPDVAAHDTTAGENLVGDDAHQIARNGEADAHVAAALAEDGGVHADHFAVQIQQRAAGIARVDRRIGLDEVFVIVDAQAGAAGGADHAGGQRVRQAERVAQRHHPFTDFQA
jgi:hypothetical protein